MTFSQILSDCYARLGFPAAPSADTVTRLKQFVNETHEELLATPGLQSLLYGSLTFASVAGVSRVGLPPSVSRVLALRETTNDITLQEQSLGWYRAVDADPDSNRGTPYYYIRLGQCAVARAPVATGTGLWAASTSAADTVPTVQIEAIRVGGLIHTPADKTLNGVTRVAIGTTPLTDYVDVTQFALSAVCAGDVTLYDAASGGNVLGVIPMGSTTARYEVIALYPTPSTAITYALDCEHEPFTLSANTDEPLVPKRFHRLLAKGARVKEYEKSNDDRYAIAKTEFERDVKAMLYHVTCPPDYVMVPGAPTSQGSNLGPWFPAGRW